MKGGPVPFFILINAIHTYAGVQPKPVYRDLLRLVQHKDYFAPTTNVDHCFQKAGFDINNVCFIHREIMDCGNALFPVIKNV